MRFSSVEHLETWKKTGAFPEIHAPICNFIAETADGSRFMDLCACFGLLGTRLAKLLKVKVTGVEGNLDFVNQATAAGIPIDLVTLRVTRDTLPRLVEIIETNGIKVIVARRAMPELWGEDLAGGSLFADQIRSAGVQEIYLEGRAKTSNAVNALASIDQEINLMSKSYKICQRRGSMARMVLR
jgi:hypothetical protein